MNNDSLIKSIGDIDPEFIKEAMPDSRRRMWARVIPAAAAAVILLVGLLTLPKILWPRGETNEKTAYGSKQEDNAEGPVEEAADGIPFEGSFMTPIIEAPEANKKAEDVSYCLSKLTLEELITRSDLIVHAECTGVGNDRDYTFRVMDSYPFRMPESLEFCIPSYRNTSLEGYEYSPAVGDRSILFFSRKDIDGENERYLYSGVIQVLEDGTLKNDSISDLGDYTYDELIKALPKLAENIGINSGD